MKIFTQNNRCPSQVLFAFDEVVDSYVRQMRWAVAYSTRKGCERLTDRVSSRMGKTRWEESNKQFITSLDFGLTDPGALEFLEELPNSQVHIANPDVIGRPGLFPRRSYHPKIFLFDNRVSTGYVVGSANLTDSALISNTEVVIVGKEEVENATWSFVWDELLYNTTPLTSRLLAEYRKRWVRPKRRIIEPDQKPPPFVITPGNKSVFWDAITTGGISPIDFDHFWIEAGSMSSGGSHNQLELPRGANRYFGFTHTNYGDFHITIGQPTLTLRQRSWNDRPLTWHGNNRMERINLPTLAQGGFEYQNTAVLFRKHNKGYEINVLPWDDDGAIAWRAASETLNTIYRLGERGDRICGLF